MSDLCMSGDIIRFTSPYDGHTWDCEVVRASEEDSQDWQRPMILVRGCKGEPHLGVLWAEKSYYFGYWSVIPKDAT